MLAKDAPHSCTMTSGNFFIYTLTPWRGRITEQSP